MSAGRTCARCASTATSERDKHEWGIEVETADGPTRMFTDFRGAGVGLSAALPEFTADHLLQLMTDLHRDRTFADRTAPPDAPPAAADPSPTGQATGD